MKIIPLISQNKNFIDSYEKGKFSVNNQEYYSSIIIFPEKIIELKKDNIDNKKYFRSFLTEEIEVLLIGTGKTRKIITSLVKSRLIKKKNLNLEFMTTDAACGTHNVLLSENRFVVTYLKPI
ncbi:Mth938-like domain-containing protein [Wolbachia endosymbiont of Dipetalonema caudispina]|uniref:Mth938-like domain-containing protein n=1 Tax=Wolbachia endosymbiont of Dipetalonema caudispina TaxID=1812112 RepID=UPI0015897908|nr:Mth938-like domain-containing protein [Wolbachia endosymbiont of Dipetalonema caudispina]